MAPTWGERIVWALGLLTEAMGGVLFVVLLSWHERFSMSWLGAGLVGMFLAFLFLMMGRATRIGSPCEVIGLNIIALVLLYALLLYGAFAFKPVDALGGSAMVALAVFCILAPGLGARGYLKWKSERARAAGWLMLLLFLIAYANHALHLWLGR
jgi:hypothetical protein